MESIARRFRRSGDEASYTLNKVWESIRASVKSAKSRGKSYDFLDLIDLKILLSIWWTSLLVCTIIPAPPPREKVIGDIFVISNGNQYPR